MDPVVVLVLSIVFIFSVVALHGKLWIHPDGISHSLMHCSHRQDHSTILQLNKPCAYSLIARTCGLADVFVEKWQVVSVCSGMETELGINLGATEKYRIGPIILKLCINWSNNLKRVL